ncbi:hypothetical protein MP228_010491 [Amoeboaphelidium protococcarum]|nr:hypothetical protein MP228_010491 [Amoeboaphelidium protococcarum]
MVRDCYWAYYGPLLAMYRVKMHSYLQLETAEDYQFFYAQYIGYASEDLLLQVARRQCVPLGEAHVRAWSEAISPPSDEYDDADSGPDCFQKYHFNEWSEYYTQEEVELYTKNEEILACSQLDLLITLGNQFAEDVLFSSGQADQNVGHRSKRTKTEDQRVWNLPYVWRFGYIHDAIRNKGVEALTFAINHYHDQFIHFGHDNLGRDASIFNKLCEYFQLGESGQVIQKLHDQCKDNPSFPDILAYYRAVQELGHQLDVSSHLQQVVVQLIEQCLSISLSEEEEDFGSNYVRRLHQLLIIPGGLLPYLRQYLSYDWVRSQLEGIKVVNNILIAWLIVEMLAVYESQDSLSLLFEKIVDKLNGGLLDEAMYLLTALISSDCARDYLTCHLKIERFHVSKAALCKVLINMLDTDYIVIDARYYSLSKAFELFEPILVDMKQEFISKVIIAFSRVHETIKDSHQCPEHQQLVRVVNALGGARGFEQFIMSLDPLTLSQCHPCVLNCLFYKYRSDYETELADQLFIKLMSECAKLVDVQKAAELLTLYLDDQMNEDVDETLGIKLKKVFPQDQLQQICQHLNSDHIEALNIGLQFQSPWIQEIGNIAQSTQYPGNITQIVQIAKEHCHKLSKAPECVKSQFFTLIFQEVLKPPQGNSRRFRLFDNLPYSVMKEKVILEQFIMVFKMGKLSIALTGKYFPSESDFVKGFFKYVRFDKVPRRCRSKLVKTFAKCVMENGSDNLKDLTQELADEYDYDIDMDDRCGYY